MRARHGACLCLVLVLWGTVAEGEASPGPFFPPGMFISAQAPVNRMLGPPLPPPAYVPPLYPQPKRPGITPMNGNGGMLLVAGGQIPPSGPVTQEPVTPEPPTPEPVTQEPLTPEPPTTEPPTPEPEPVTPAVVVTEELPPASPPGYPGSMMFINAEAPMNRMIGSPLPPPLPPPPPPPFPTFINAEAPAAGNRMLPGGSMFINAQAPQPANNRMIMMGVPPGAPPATGGNGNGNGNGGGNGNGSGNGNGNGN